MSLGYLLDESLKAWLFRRVHGGNSTAYKSCHFGKQMRKESRIFRFGRLVARTERVVKEGKKHIGDRVLSCINALLWQCPCLSIDRHTRKRFSRSVYCAATYTSSFLNRGCLKSIPCLFDHLYNLSLFPTWEFSYATFLK